MKKSIIPNFLFNFIIFLLIILHNFLSTFLRNLFSKNYYINNFLLLSFYFFYSYFFFFYAYIFKSSAVGFNLSGFKANIVLPPFYIKSALILKIGSILQKFKFIKNKKTKNFIIITMKLNINKLFKLKYNE